MKIVNILNTSLDYDYLMYVMQSRATRKRGQELI
jgi:hypothetical protein